ncbi:MAG TPA: urease accessory UreF family protein [Chthoniobacterales bacterium]
MIESGEAGLAFLLQTSDAMFPTGAYAHSLGMEEMIRAGHVFDEASLLAFLRRHILPAARRVDLPLAAWAHRAARQNDFAALLETDGLAGALRPARELRAASLQTGRRRLAMLAAVRPAPLLREYQRAAEESPHVGHHAPVWGAACAAVSLPAALTAYHYQTLACFCAAAPKLLRIGQEAAQRVLTAALAEAGAAIEFAQRVERGDIGWFDPVLDIASMRHEIADERLFIS